MNIALGAVFIFILLIPPIAFYVSYSSGPFAKAGPKFSLLDGVLASAIFSLFIHALAITFLGREIRFDLLLKLVGGELKDLENKVTNQEFTYGLQQFALYNAITFSLALVLGRFCRVLVIRYDIHFKYELLRLHNKWWYLFNGYYLSEVGREHRTYDLLFVDAVVVTGNGTYIYSGYLVDFVCTGEELDRLYLNDATRRELKQKENAPMPKGLAAVTTEPVSIPGEFFCIAYKEVKNLNLRFITLDISLEDIENLPDIDDFPDGALPMEDALQPA